MEMQTISQPTHEPTTDEVAERYFIRLNRSERIQHFLFALSFIVLAITGFMVRIPEEIVHRFGNAGETIFLYRSLLHRIAGAVMIAVSGYHLLYLLFTRSGRRLLVDMLPRLQDLKEIFHGFMYYLGFKAEPPEFDRFGYKQKMEYGGLLVGTPLMAVTGVLLWTEYLWSKFVLDISILVHGMEATLACLSIIVWHLYEVILKPHKSPTDTVWLHGVIDEAEMKEEYGRHYRKVMADPKLQAIYLRHKPAA